MLEKIKYLEWLSYVKKCNAGNYSKININVELLKKVKDAKNGKSN